jgi:hypothetical protein
LTVPQRQIILMHRVGMTMNARFFKALCERRTENGLRNIQEIVMACL